ncbi:peptidoglycan editing factor PgeF [soil metagenome]
MLTYTGKKLFIYFGDATDGISKSLHCISTNAKLVDAKPFKSVAQKIDVPRLSALNQTHGIDGVQIQDADFSFNKDGDYLITDQKDVGLGILTADCVPMIFYDTKNNAIGIAHAGWRGALAGIAQKTLDHMQRAWNTQARDVQIFIGPSAKTCCYQVQKDFLQNLLPEYVDKVMMQKEGHWYFDTVQLIALQMHKAEVAPASINLAYNFCTMCDERFFSHRRQHTNAGRQITIVRLK